MLNSDLSPVAPKGGREPPQKNPCGFYAQAGPDKLGLRQDIATIRWVGRRKLFCAIEFLSGWSS